MTDSVTNRQHVLELVRSRAILSRSYFSNLRNNTRGLGRRVLNFKVPARRALPNFPSPRAQELRYV